MRNPARSCFLYLLVLLCCACHQKPAAGTISVEDGKRVTDIQFVEVFHKEFDWMRWCLPLSNHFLCLELMDKSYKEYRFNLYDSSGDLMEEKRILSGDGPNEIKVVSQDEVWLSSTGQIHILDNDYLKSIDPHTFRVTTINKLSNVIKQYGSKFTVGKHSQTIFEERDGRMITTFEAAGFYVDLTYYLVILDADFRNLSILAEFKKERPWTWRRLDERKTSRNGKILTYTDYFERTRLRRMFAVDWKRNVVYLVPDIDKPEIVWMDIDDRRRGRFILDIQPENFAINKEELDAWRQNVLDNSPSILRQRTEINVYIPEHAPAIMNIAVVGDRLIVITGKRNWRDRKNETLFFRLPDLRNEGSLELPFPSFYQRTRFIDDYYIVIDRTDDDRTGVRIFQLNQKNAATAIPTSQPAKTSEK